MKSEKELYDELCEVMAVSGDLDSGELTSNFITWFLEQLKIYGCDNKDLVIAAVNKYVTEKVTNVFVKQLIDVIIKTSVAAFCG